MCPNCKNTLTVVPSDPPDTSDGRPSSIVTNTVGEPPFFLYCNHCRWDSAEVGMTFEKPTGLASESENTIHTFCSANHVLAQLQSFEDSAPESLEFERLKEHFEPFLRASSSTSGSTPSHSHHAHTNPITAAASSALSRDIPGVAKYTPLVRSRSGRDRGTGRNEIPTYKARFEMGTAGLMIGGGGDTDVEFMRGMETESEVASLEQRCTNSWTMSLRTK